MKLSILDQAPISTGQTAKDALYNAMELARAGESFGYTRYWIAEHHDLPGLASSAPEVMLGFIGAHTSTIRIGSGAVLLPHYKPYKVAEVFNLLSVLFPGRIDLGIGRAPGGSAEATTALSGQFLQKVYKMPELVEELLHFLYHDFPEENIFSRVKAAPVPVDPPHAWLLGTSGKSAVLAARSGMSYAFGQFMSEQDGAAILKQYEQAFTPRKPGDAPQTLLTVSAVCAETAEKAEEVAWSSLIWQLQAEKGGQASVPSIEEAKSYPLTGKDKEKLAKMKQNMVIGNPQQVRAAFTKLQEKYGTDELMIFTIAHSFEDRIASYRYIAEEVLG